MSVPQTLLWILIILCTVRPMSDCNMSLIYLLLGAYHKTREGFFKRKVMSLLYTPEWYQEKVIPIQHFDPIEYLP